MYTRVPGKPAERIETRTYSRRTIVTSQPRASAMPPQTPAIIRLRRLRWSAMGPLLPHPAGVLAHHRRARRARERLLELGHVRDHAVHAVAAGGMGVGLGAQPGALLGLVLAPDLAPAQEQPLLGREPVA